MSQSDVITELLDNFLLKSRVHTEESLLMYAKKPNWDDDYKDGVLNRFVFINLLFKNIEKNKYNKA